MLQDGFEFASVVQHVADKLTESLNYTCFQYSCDTNNLMI